MSNRALTWAFKQKTGSSAAKLLLVTLADMANDKTLRAFPCVKEICERTELNRKTVITATRSLIDQGLLIDTKEKIGRTQCIPIYTFPLPPASDTENGTVSEGKQSRFCHEAVPNLPTSSPVFTGSSPKNGPRNPINHSLSQKEPIALRPLSEKEQLEVDLKAHREYLSYGDTEPKEKNRVLRGIERMEKRLSEIAQTTP